MKILKKRITDLLPAEYNPRKDLKPEDPEYQKIKKSILEFDYIDPIIWNEHTGRVVGGHQRLKVLQELGRKEVEVSVVDLSEAKEKALNIALNKTTGEWDFPKLKDLLIELDTGDFDIELTGFDEIELEDLVAQFGEEDKTGLIDDDAIPDKVEPITKAGDLWILGNHRVLCGDARKRENVEVLMNGERADMAFTDPPYGVSYIGVNNPNGKKWDMIANDELRGARLLEFLKDSFANLAQFTKENPAIYVFHASSTQTIFEEALSVNGIKVKQQLIWNKGMILGHSDYHWAHEPIFYCVKNESNCTWYGGRTHTTILNKTTTEIENLEKEELVKIIETMKDGSTNWEIQRDNVLTYRHPTQKPVGLATRGIKNNTLPGETVLDLFLGSGTTLMGCEKTGRVCRGMELDPHNCDVIVKRWEDYTGEKPEKGKST